jgi:hypothetical protein
VLIAFLAGSESGGRFLAAVNLEESLVHALTENGYFVLGVIFFAAMGAMLYRVARRD